MNKLCDVTVQDIQLFVFAIDRSCGEGEGHGRVKYTCQSLTSSLTTKVRQTKYVCTQYKDEVHVKIEYTYMFVREC